MNPWHRFFLSLLPILGLIHSSLLLADTPDDKLKARYSEAWLSYQNALALKSAGDYQEALEAIQKACDDLGLIQQADGKWEKEVMAATLKDCQIELPELTKLARSAGDGSSSAMLIDLDTSAVDELTVEASLLTKAGDLETSCIRLTQASILLDVLMMTDSGPNNRSLRYKIRAMLVALGKQMNSSD